MSLLRALRAYVGLGPDEEIERDYLGELEDPRAVVDLTADESPNGDPSERSQERAGSPAGKTGGNAHRRKAVSRHSNEANGTSSAQSSRRSEPEMSRPRSDPPRTAESQRASQGQAVEPDPFDTPSDGVVLKDKAPSHDNQGDAVVHSLDSVRTKPKTIVPESFSDAKDLADDFKFGTPLVLNLQGADRELARRIIDFASGLCYGLDGSMEKIASQVFLVSPAGVEIRDEDRELIRQRGYAR